MIAIYARPYHCHNKITFWFKKTVALAEHKSANKILEHCLQRTYADSENEVDMYNINKSDVISVRSYFSPEWTRLGRGRRLWISFVKCLQATFRSCLKCRNQHQKW